MIDLYRVKEYCCGDISKIENYDEAINSNQTWDCHHRLELIKTGAVVNSSIQDLKDWGIYYNRPSDELIFLPKSEHMRLHMLYGDKRNHAVPFEHNYFHTHKFCGKENGFYGKKHTPEALAKMSRLGMKHSPEAKSKISKTTLERMTKIKEVYKQYKTSGGSLKWNEFQKQYKENK